MVADVMIVVVHPRSGSIPPPRSAPASRTEVGHHAAAAIVRTVGPEAMGEAPVAIALGHSRRYVTSAGEAGEGVVHGLVEVVRS